MALLEEVKAAVRVTTNDADIVGEIQELIDSAKQDLVAAGVDQTKVDAAEPDAIIKRAIKTYAKANFGYDNSEAERFQQSYIMLKQHLSLYGDYRSPVNET